MIFILKRKKAVAAILLMTVLVFFGGVLKEFIKTEETFLPSDGRCVIIDAGHPGIK